MTSAELSALRVVLASAETHAHRECADARYNIAYGNRRGVSTESAETVLEYYSTVLSAIGTLKSLTETPSLEIA